VRRRDWRTPGQRSAPRRQQLANPGRIRAWNRGGEADAYAPIIWFGNQVAIPGKNASRTMARIMIATNGSAPHSTVVNGTCGATPLSTYRLSPTGGVISPT